MLSEVLVEVKELSREVQHLKYQLAEGSPQAAEATAPMPIKLPLSTEEEFFLAESFLEDESVRKQIVSYCSDCATFALMWIIQCSLAHISSFGHVNMTIIQELNHLGLTFVF